MSKLLMMIGLPACGKSTLAKELSRNFNANIHSSDELRLELYGDYNVFDKNTELFDVLHKRILKDLSSDKNVVFDATNLSMKKRKYFLSLVPKDVERLAIVVATEYNECIRRDLNRDKKVGERVIKSMRENFQFPLEREGFDDIVVQYEDAFSEKDLYTTTKLMNEFEQDNPHHTFTLGEHCKVAFQLAHDESFQIKTALYMHDLGKLYTKTFVNKKKEKTEVAHYYNHHNVSAYEYMFYFKLDTISEIYTCQLINYHMQPYFIESEKSKRKWLDIFGENMYNDIMIINKYDRLAH